MSRRGCACIILLIAGIFLNCATGVRAEPRYVRKEGLAETLLATRVACLKGGAELSDADARRIWGSVCEDFPVEAREMELHVKNARQWLRRAGATAVEMEQKFVRAAVDRLDELPGSEAVMPFLRDALARLPEDSSAAGSRRRLKLLVLTCNCRQVLERIKDDPARLSRLMEEISRREPHGDALAREAEATDLPTRLSRLHRQWRGHMNSLVDAVRAGRKLDPERLRDYAAELTAVRREVAKLRLRSFGVEEILFAVRECGNDWHWYANFGYWSSNPERKLYGALGRLCRLNLRTGEETILLDDPEGSVRDPVISYDADRVLFSYRKGGTEHFHLYEMDLPGPGPLRQITDGKHDDIEPCFLPDGRIMFCSSRCRRWVPCWHSQVATIYRCGPDGGNVECISPNVETDNTPWPLPDGRVLYTRWEYTDRSQVEWHHLWTFNPDGTGVMTWFGNMKFPGVLMIDAKPIPGTNKAVATFMGGHGRNEHYGAVTVVDPDGGPDDEDKARRISRDEYIPRYGRHNGPQQWRDPYALSEDCFLVARQRSIMVMDGRGRYDVIYSLGDDVPAGDGGHAMVHEPRPVRPRPRERVVPDRTDPAEPTGQLVLADVTRGRNMAGVETGEIEKLLVLEMLPKPVNFSGIQEPITLSNYSDEGGNWGTYFIYRVLGTVPVEEDGSAYFEVPALRCVFFVALDEKDISVKRMQSFCNVMPGELTGCVGCHEPRIQAPHDVRERSLLATRRAPSRIRPVRGVPDVFDYPRHIQPILDRHCVRCHNYEKYAGKLSLTGDHGPWYSHSYANLLLREQVAHGGTRGNRLPRSNGTAVSPLLDKLDGSHHDVRLSDHERRMIRTWIHAGATYPGTYASLGSGMVWPDIDAGFLKRRCNSCHKDRPLQKYISGRFGFVESHLNLSRPQKSLLLLAPLAESAGGLGLCRQSDDEEEEAGRTEAVFADKTDPDYQKILAEITDEAEKLREMKRFDMPGFVPNEHYIREMKRYGVLGKSFDLSEDRVDVYKLDREYWRLFWHSPEGRKTVGVGRPLKED